MSSALLVFVIFSFLYYDHKKLHKPIDFIDANEFIVIKEKNSTLQSVLKHSGIMKSTEVYP